jgi:energy-coupling factor transport system ATP-binding protein
MISFSNVSLVYPNSRKTILENLSFTVNESELILIIGLTGAGKSSFMKLINGLIPHHTSGILSGEIIVAGQSINQLKPGQLSGIIGIVGQNPLNGFVTDQVEDEIAFGLETNGIERSIIRRRVEEVIDLLGLQPIRKRSLSTLSGGEQQRVAIASALVMNPKVLVLDEPTSALDPVAAEEVLAIINKLVHDLGLTVIMAEHKLERVIHFVDRIVLVEGDGQVQIGTPQEIMSTTDINPPIVKVAKHLNLAELPLSVRELKRVTSKWQFPVKTLQSTQIEENAVSVEVVDLSVQLSNKTALNKVNLRFTTGEIVSVMGRNGAGKSTLLRTIAGGSNQFTGKVRLAGSDASKLTGKDLVSLIGYVPQEPADLFFGSSVKNECTHTDEQNGLEQGSTEEILVALSPSINVNTHPRDLSEGQKLVLALALVLVTKPKILILDEPTRGLDYRAKDQLTQILKEIAANSVTVILATHDVELVAELATRVVVIADGEIISDGQTRDVLTSSPAFAPQVSKAFSSQNWLTVADVIFTDIKRVD